MATNTKDKSLHQPLPAPLLRNVVETKTVKGLPVLTCRSCGETKEFSRVMVNKVKRYLGYIEFHARHNSGEAHNA